MIRDATDLVSTVASWLQADHDGLTGKVLKQPERAEMDTPVQEQLHRRALFEVTKKGISLATRTMDFQIPRIVHEEVDEHRGVFQIEPLDRGFGHTFGDSLRRVLLSSLEGAAVTSVKVEGTAHEFTTLPGVREDVTDIVLNLKNLVYYACTAIRPRSRCTSRRRAPASSPPPTSRRLPSSRSSTRSSRSRTSPIAAVSS